MRQIDSELERLELEYFEGRKSRSELREALDYVRERVQSSRDIDSPNPSLERSLLRLDEIVDLAALNVSDDLYEEILLSDRAAAANDWDEAIGSLLDVYEVLEGRRRGQGKSVKTKGLPLILKKRLAAALANRAGTYYDAIRQENLPVGALRLFCWNALEDLRDAAFLDPSNEVIQNTKERVRKTWSELPDEDTAPFIERGMALARKGNWTEAISCIRECIRSQPPPPQMALRVSLAKLLFGAAEKQRGAMSREEEEKVLELLFEAHLLDTKSSKILIALESSIQSLGKLEKDGELVESALSLVLLHLRRGAWGEALRELPVSNPQLAHYLELARNTEIVETLDYGKGREYFLGLPQIGSRNSMSIDRAGRSSADSAMGSFLYHCLESPDGLGRSFLSITRYFAQESSLRAIFEAALNKDFDRVSREVSSLGGTASRNLMLVFEKTILLHRANTELSDLELNSEGDDGDFNESLARVKSYILSAESIHEDWGGANRVTEELKIRYDDLLSSLGEGNLSVTTFGGDRSWRYFVITMLMIAVAALFVLL